MDCLVIERDKGPASCVVISPETRVLTIGRAPRNDIVLGAGRVSKLHARITREDTGFVVHDLKSTNGTLVEGNPIAIPTPIGPAQVVSIGPYRLRIETSVRAESGLAVPPPFSMDVANGRQPATVVDLLAPGAARPSRSRSGTSTALVTWHDVAERVIAACRDRQWFLSRQDERALKHKADGDYRVGGEMVEAMERFARMARDRALGTLHSWQPPAGVCDLPSIIQQVIAVLEGELDEKDYYGRLGVAYVISHLRRLRGK